MNTTLSDGFAFKFEKLIARNLPKFCGGQLYNKYYYVLDNPKQAGIIYHQSTKINIECLAIKTLEFSL